MKLAQFCCCVVAAVGCFYKPAVGIPVYDINTDTPLPDTEISAEGIEITEDPVQDVPQPNFAFGPWYFQYWGNPNTNNTAIFQSIGREYGAFIGDVDTAKGLLRDTMSPWTNLDNIELEYQCSSIGRIVEVSVDLGSSYLGGLGTVVSTIMDGMGPTSEIDIFEDIGTTLNAVRNFVTANPHAENAPHLQKLNEAFRQSRELVRYLPVSRKAGVTYMAREMSEKFSTLVQSIADIIEESTFITFLEDNRGSLMRLISYKSGPLSRLEKKVEAGVSHVFKYFAQGMRTPKTKPYNPPTIPDRKNDVITNVIEFVRDKRFLSQYGYLRQFFLNCSGFEETFTAKLHTVDAIRMLAAYFSKAYRRFIETHFDNLSKLPDEKAISMYIYTYVLLDPVFPDKVTGREKAQMFSDVVSGRDRDGSELWWGVFAVYCEEFVRVVAWSGDEFVESVPYSFENKQTPLELARYYSAVAMWILFIEPITERVGDEEYVNNDLATFKLPQQILSVVPDVTADGKNIVLESQYPIVPNMIILLKAYQQGNFYDFISGQKTSTNPVVKVDVTEIMDTVWFRANPDKMSDLGVVMSHIVRLTKEGESPFAILRGLQDSVDVYWVVRLPLSIHSVYLSHNATPETLRHEMDRLASRDFLGSKKFQNKFWGFQWRTTMS
eukprot:GHVQ01015067.1.p1 GENE.GHVQ01015067.1~~GHVQ01015067.1.p1  ORF type:complete len:663 (+),score=71.12 GHVQ01015067.1:300-2288(+)